MKYRFRDFELDISAAELRHGGQRVHLQEQPLRLLLKLAERPGAVVSRAELERALWPDGTIVDYEIGINNAVRKLRQALGDSAERQSSIETVPRRGYCLREALTPVGAGGQPAAPAASSSPRRALRWAALASTLSVALAIVLLAAMLFLARSREGPRVLAIREITSDGGIDLLAKPVSRDGYLYYLDRTGGEWLLMRNRADSNEPVAVAMPFPNPRLFDISPDGRQWLLGSISERDAPAAVWLRPGPGAAPVRVTGLTAYDAVWFPDGRHVLLSRGDGLWSARPDGAELHRVAALPGVATWLSWTPDATRIRFTLTDESGADSIWQWQPGGAPWPVFPGAGGQRCCGDWSQDGRFFIYSAMNDGVWNVWAQSSLRHVWRPAPTPPVQLTVGPESAQGAFTGFAPRSFVFYQWHEVELPQRLDLHTHQFQPLLSGRAAIHLVYSRDGRRLAFLDLNSTTVWTAEVAPDGAITGPRRLTPAGVPAAFPRWSPDGSELAYTAEPERQPERAMLIAAAGGPPHPLLADLPDVDVSQPDWSPGGRRLVVALRRHLPQGWRYSLAIVDRATRHITELPGSLGLTAPRWSPDGRFIAAFSEDQHRLMVFNLAASSWRQVASGRAFTIPVWSRDSAWVYYQDLLAPGQPLFRVAVASGRQQAVAEFSAALAGGYHRCGFMDLAPDGSPLISFNRGTANLRLATLELP